MAEHSEPLRAALVELQRQLADRREITPELRELLVALVVEIQRILCDQAAETPMSSSSQTRRRESLVTRLTEAARQFEDTHPTLAGTIGSAIDALGRMGV